MLCVAIHIHRHILSSQGYIRYTDDSPSVDTIQVECTSSELALLMLKNDQIIKKVNIRTPNDVFIPSSLSSDPDFPMNSASSIACRTKSTSDGKYVAECSFRFKVSEVEKLDQSELELSFDVTEYFKEWFNNPTEWHMMCASCGVRLPIKPLFIESVRAYCDSELSEGWFCHGNVARPIPQPSTHILYLDDTSFYLSRKPNSNVSCKKTCVLDKSDDCKHSADDENEYFNISKAPHSAIECHSCGDVLSSERSIPFIKFFFDKLLFKDPLFTNDHLRYARRITLLSFWTLVKKSRSLLPSKLFLQSKVRDEERCLLLWIPTSPVGQFLLQESLEGIPLEIDMKTEPVYKILYFVGTSRSEIVRSWRSDFNVDYHRVSDTMIKTLIEILDASSSYQPKKDEDEDFSCGFMKAPSLLWQ